MKHLIVIDDTASPGNMNQSRFLKENRKTFVAVFVHSEIRKKLDNSIKGIVSILKNEFGIERLHFTDLINKKDKYSQLSNEDVLFLFDEISTMISNIDLPYFVQTCHNNTLKENGIIIQENILIDGLNLNKNEDASLFLLLVRIKFFLKKKYYYEKTEIIMDQGRKKPNQTEKLKILEGIIENSQIIYKSSKEYHLLQVADYFAYSVNRMQMSAIKENRTKLDNDILRLISKALENQDAYGVTISEVDIENYGKDEYDYLQYTQRQIDGNLNKWKNAQK